MLNNYLEKIGAGLALPSGLCATTVVMQMSEWVGGWHKEATCSRSGKHWLLDLARNARRH